MLYVVATPIGNREDITLRALRVLREADFIICEDTRVTHKLFVMYDIKKERVSCHHHSSSQSMEGIIHRLKKGESAALVTDAGTPGISDPGNVFVSHALAELRDCNFVSCLSNGKERIYNLDKSLGKAAGNIRPGTPAFLSIMENHFQKNCMGKCRKIN